MDKMVDRRTRSVERTMKQDLYRVTARKPEYGAYRWEADVYYFDKKIGTLRSDQAWLLRYKVWRLKRQHKSLSGRFDQG
jgi:hypothetical protein